VIILSEEDKSRVYTINLSKVWLSPRIRRTKRAINMIREFAQRHMKSENIKIDQNLNETMWERGIRHPPRKIRVKMTKDEDDVVTVSLYSEEAKEVEKVEEEAKVETAVPTMAAENVKEDIEEEQEIRSSEPKKIAQEAEEETKKKEKPEKKDGETEPEKTELSEEELAGVLAEETEGLEIKQDEKSKEESKE